MADLMKWHRVINGWWEATHADGREFRIVHHEMGVGRRDLWCAHQIVERHPHGDTVVDLPYIAKRLKDVRQMMTDYLDMEGN